MSSSLNTPADSSVNSCSLGVKLKLAGRFMISTTMTVPLQLSQIQKFQDIDTVSKLTLMTVCHYQQ